MKNTFLFSAVLALGVIAAPASQALVPNKVVVVQKPVVKVVKPAPVVVKPVQVVKTPVVKNAVIIDAKLVSDDLVKKGSPKVIKKHR